MGFDRERILCFPTSEGRELQLKVDIKTGFATISESLDGEVEQISINTCEIQTIAKFIGLLEQSYIKHETYSTIPTTTKPYTPKPYTPKIS